MLDFIRTMALFPLHWRLWLAALFAANFAAPLFFLAGDEGRMVLGAGLIAGAIELVIFARLGFLRLLGAGHFVWFPLVAWLWMRLEGIAHGSALWYWTTVVIVINCLSLVIDVVDVMRFLRGERAPQLALNRQ